MTGGVIALVGTFLPWLRTGQHQRSSYELSSVATHLHVATGLLEHWTVTVWPVVPLALLAATVLLVIRRTVAARVLGAGVSVYVLAVCFVVSRTSLEMRIGVPVTLGGAALLLLGVVSSDRVPA